MRRIALSLCLTLLGYAVIVATVFFGEPGFVYGLLAGLFVLAVARTSRRAWAAGPQWPSRDSADPAVIEAIAGPEPESGPLQFDLKDLFVAFVFVASSAGLGPYGVLFGAFVLALIVLIRVVRAIRSPLALEALLILAIAGCCVLGWPLAVSPKGPARRAVCMNNLKQIGLAMLNYEQANGHFPPAYTADDRDRPMHSWRIEMLPYLDHMDLYRAYRFDEPWDGPNNRRLAGQMPIEFVCPSRPDGDAPTTSYVAVVGPGTAWPGGEGAALSDFRDGPENTILLVEVADADIHWMEPRDLTWQDIATGLHPKTGPGVDSYHPKGVNVLMADASVRHLPSGTPTSTLKALLTIDGGEEVDIDAVWTSSEFWKKSNPRYKNGPLARSIDYTIPRLVALPIMLVCGALLLFRPRRAVPAATDDAEASRPPT
ncbi:MAG: DUF1559 domain-containing protein [Pirellulales bacterium]|nr:DUF1559 domain-containing protein [Pirellulales bacterium]